MKYLRLLFAVTFLLVTASPVFAQDASALSGVVVDTSGAPVAGAAVSVRPSRAKPVIADAHGRFVLPPLPSGVYEVIVQKPGFIMAERANVTVPLTGELRVALEPSTLSTLQQIASVSTSSNSQLNTSASSITVLDQQHFIDQGQIQIGHVLDQTPGIVSARPGTGNAAVPGSITSPNLRGALDYEKATLIDGFPLVNGVHGDYPTMLVNSLLFDNIEIVKGPTAYAPEINYGIGGTMNFRTADPTQQPSGLAVYGLDNFDGQVGDLKLSDTIGKLGYVFNIASYGTQGPLNSQPTYVTLPANTLIDGSKLTTGTISSKPVNGAKGPYPVAGVIGTPGNAYTTLVACCQDVSSDYFMRGEVAKLQYHFSGTTALTAGYIGIQGNYDAPAGNLLQSESTFAPAAAYNASGMPFAPDNQLLLNGTTTIPDQRVYDNEPMFESELRTAVGRDTFLARYYSAVLERQTVSDQGSPAPYATNLSLWGTAFLNGSPTPTAFNGQPENVVIPAANAYTNNMSDHDYLHGFSFEDDHPMGDSLLTFAYDRNTSLTNSYKLAVVGGQPTVVTSIAPGTRQDFTTYLLRGVLPVTDRGQLTLADYQNVYQNYYTPFVSSGVYTFASSTSTHNDPRLGFSYRLNPDTSLRFSAGSAIAPPYPALIDSPNQTPAQVTPVAGTITIAQNAGLLKPETSFGYDLGADVRFKSGDILSTDLYQTNIWNQFVSYTYDTGTQFQGNEVFVSTNANLAQSRYEGVEFTLHRDPQRGWGYTFSGSLERAYPYGIPAGAYATATNPYGTNLAVVPGINFYSNGLGYNGISNKSEAYSMGYAAVHHRGTFGQFAEVGLTYYGPNNTFNIPAFFVGSATYRQPIGRSTSVQLSADNLFDADSLKYNYYGIGSQAIPAPLVNAQTGWRGQVPYGPATFRVLLIQNLGH